MATYSNSILFANSIGLDTKVRLVKSKKKEEAINASDQIPDGGFVVIVEYSGTRYVKITDGKTKISDIPVDGEGDGGEGDAATLNGQAGAYYLNRANHTGTQAISTVSGLQGALDGKATAAQGALADTAVQPGDLPATPTWTTISGKPAFVAEGANAAAARTALGLGTAATTASTAYATSAQGSLADTSIQPDDTSDVAVAGKVALYSNIGAINTVAPQFPENAVNLAYFDAGLATKQATLSVPSQAEAEAGTATTARSWTAQRGKQSVVGASRSVISVSGSKTLALTDEYTFQNVTAAATITVPANATVALPVGSQIDFFQAGAGVITFAAAGGVTIISKGSTLATSEAGDAATLKKTATNTWALIIAG